MAKFTVANSAKGARGVDSILFEPGTTVQAELTEEQAVLIGGFDDVKVTEVKAVPAKKS